jgi:hypothetical protein
MKGAGGGRPAKPEGQRRNRNALTKEPIHVSSDARVVDVPAPMVALGEVGDRVWAAMWLRPVATLWDPVDVPALTRMVLLQVGEPDPKTLAEIRQLEDRFLLNPYARAQQRVVIDGGDPDEEAIADVSELDDFTRRLRQSG